MKHEEIKHLGQKYRRSVLDYLFYEIVYTLVSTFRIVKSDFQVSMPTYGKFLGCLTQIMYQ